MTPPEPLSPRARSLLDAARDELGPDDAAIARMRNRVLTGTAGGIGVAAAAKASASGMSLGVKLVIASLLAAAIGGGTWWIVRDGAGSPAATPAVAPEIAAPSATVPVVVASIESAPARAARPELPPPEPVAAPVTPAPRRTAPRAAAAAPSLADEVALVDDAMAALRNSDPAAALAAADDHVKRFGRRGQLTEEATAIRVEALCRLGDGRWSEAFDDFDVRFPRSAQRPRLSAACKGIQ